MEQPAPNVEGRDPLPNRFTRGTAVGCLGILGVFTLPVFTMLPVDTWRWPGWALQLYDLLGFAAMAGGAWLLARVPSSRARLEGDPWHPLTRAGRAPIVEQPALRSHRATLAAIWGLVLLMAVSYVLAGLLAGKASGGIPVAVIGALGVVGVALGVAVALGRMPVPAWRWVRMPVNAGIRPQGVATALVGAAALAWSLLAASGAGYGWGRVGLPLLVVASVVITPLWQRWPRRSEERPAERVETD